VAYFYDPKYKQELRPLLELKDEGDDRGGMQQKTFGVKAGSPEHELASEMMTKHAIVRNDRKNEVAMKWFCHSWDCAPTEVRVDRYIQHSLEMHCW
jgi:hypothetical protein